MTPAPAAGRGNSFANGPLDKLAIGAHLAEVGKLTACTLWERI